MYSGELTAYTNRVVHRSWLPTINGSPFLLFVYVELSLQSMWVQAGLRKQQQFNSTTDQHNSVQKHREESRYSIKTCCVL